jgi:hypothetical protein
VTMFLMFRTFGPDGTVLFPESWSIPLAGAER